MAAQGADDGWGLLAAAWAQAFLGAIVFLSPFLAAPAEFRWWHWNAWAVGALLVLLGAAAAIRNTPRGDRRARGASVHLVAGLWLVVAAVLGAAETVFFVLSALLGAAVVSVAAYATTAEASVVDAAD